MLWLAGGQHGWLGPPHLHCPLRHAFALRMRPHALCSCPLHHLLCVPQDVGKVLERAQECDPTTWTREQAAANNHVTAGKHTPEDRRRLQRVLEERREIRLHLCALAGALGYEDPRCNAPERSGSELERRRLRAR